jgi:hypothetical protein
LRWGLAIFFAHAGLEPQSFCSQGDRHVLSHPDIDADGGLVNFLSGLASNHDPPDLCLPSS